MASVNKAMLSNMTTKQKVTAGIVVILFLIVIWQVIGMFSGSAPAPASVPVAAKNAMAAGSPQGAPAGQQPSAMPQMPASNQPAAMPQSDQIAQGNVPKSDMLAAQQEMQKNYVDALNQLQMLRIEKEIEETTEAIAAAKLKTATSQKSTNDILAKPLPPAISEAGYGNQLAGGPGAGPGSPPGPGGPPKALPEQAPEIPYVVISVSMEMNKWNAVVGYKGDLYTVTIGDVLPVDGSVVANITKNGVILRKGEQRRKISLLTSI